MTEKKRTLSITFYPDFQNVKSIMEELHVLLIPSKEQKKVLLNVPVAGFCNDKSLKYYLFRSNQPKLRRVEDVNHMGTKLA